MKVIKGEYNKPEIKLVKFDLSDVLTISDTDIYDNGLDDIDWDLSDFGGNL